VLLKDAAHVAMHGGDVYCSQALTLCSALLACSGPEPFSFSLWYMRLCDHEAVAVRRAPWCPSRGRPARAGAEQLHTDFTAVSPF